jgi:hypothetical protein
MLIHAKRYTSVGLVLALVFFVMLPLNSCTEQPSISFEPAKAQTTYLSKLASVTNEGAASIIKTTAKGLAVLLRDKQYRRILEMEKENASGVVEEKFDAVKFITTERSVVMNGETQTVSMVELFQEVVTEAKRQDFVKSVAA